MSQSSEREIDYETLSNKQLLERVAALDHDTYPIAEIAERALTQLEDSDA